MANNNLAKPGSANPKKDRLQITPPIIVRPHDTFMKKTMFTLIWMVVFFIVGVIIFSAFTHAMVQLSHHPSHSTNLTATKVRLALTDDNFRLVVLVDRLCSFGLPILAFVLCTLGKLPGTRSRKGLLQA